MKKKLLGYIIGGQTIGQEILSWEKASLNGNSPFLVISQDSSIVDGYNDISSITAWHNFGSSVANDYLVMKFEIRELVKEIGWVNLSDAEKDIAIETYSYDSIQDAVIYLMGKGLTQEQAQGLLVTKWHRHHGNLLDVCSCRWFYVKFIVAQYLSFADAEELLDTCQQLIWAYTECGRLGMNYGDNNTGLMDYIESTNAFLNQGMQEGGYALIHGTWSEFIGKMHDVLVGGIYIKYDI
jgi:hypothetical protein